ncbi:hypothetical protein GE061_003198 [Apolygus lucorum]|uniref:HMG box domain-containing protein n=1 Tax=Apolygus lucorum TaxID=248454 RepID=A0A6A4JD60_APOLU|nr:hypothetical protein GE061_003198 [Apolygus lucorum]
MAYILFAKDQWRKRKPNMSFTAYAKEIANRWNNMDEGEKMVWQEKAAREKHRKKQELARAPPMRPKPSIKGPRTAYIFFCMDKRKVVMRDNPNVPLMEISRILGNMWSKLTSTEREAYRMKAEKDKKRYYSQIKKSPKASNGTSRGRQQRRRASPSSSEESSPSEDDV